MQKINGIVFSKDRPAQLKLFLDSVNKHAPDVFNISVIISHTSEDFDKGYGRVVNDPLFSGVKFLSAEPDFKDQVLRILKSDLNYSSFFLDDDIIYNQIRYEDVDNQLSTDDDVVCFSLRLGENVNKCYTLGVDNVMHDIKKTDRFMKWDWSLHYLDFGYPFAMDGHIFRTTDIYKLTKKSKFNNVEELEMSLFEFAEGFPRNLMTSYIQSALVNAPLSRVQQSIEDEAIQNKKITECREKQYNMNKEFLEGRILDLESINPSEIEGCHQELELNFKL